MNHGRSYELIMLYSEVGKVEDVLGKYYHSKLEWERTS